MEPPGRLERPPSGSKPDALSTEPRGRIGSGGGNRTRSPLLTRQSLIRIELRRSDWYPAQGSNPVRQASRACPRSVSRGMKWNGPGRRTRTSARRRIRPLLWLLSYPRVSMWWPVADSNRGLRLEGPGPWTWLDEQAEVGRAAGCRSRRAGLMRPRSRLGAAQHVVDLGRFELPCFCVRSSCSAQSSCRPTLVPSAGFAPASRGVRDRTLLLELRGCMLGGGSGIRTQEGRQALAVFETAAIGRTLPTLRRLV